jgi:hypothetical protein
MRLFGLGSEELARIEIPGTAEVELPAGKVKLRFEQKRESSQKQAFAAPALEIEITPEGGGTPLEVKPPRAASGSAGKVMKAPAGAVEVPAAGRYGVTVSSSVNRPEPVLVLLA